MPWHQSLKSMSAINFWCVSIAYITLPNINDGHVACSQYIYIMAIETTIHRQCHSWCNRRKQRQHQSKTKTKQHSTNLKIKKWYCFKDMIMKTATGGPYMSCVLPDDNQRYRFSTCDKIGFQFPLSSPVHIWAICHCHFAVYIQLEKLWGNKPVMIFEIPINRKFIYWCDFVLLKHIKDIKPWTKWSTF